jgi:signal transduction histidine kinase
MVAGAWKLSGVWKSMNSASALARPITGEVGRDGRLIRADESLRKLNARAGGVEGGIIGVPALYKLCVLAGRLRMRLARAVKVSDENENLELWVEAAPHDHGVRISILSWKNLGPHLAGDIGNQSFDQPRGTTNLLFDNTLRLIGTAGEPLAELGPADFGKPASDLFAKLFETGKLPSDIISNLYAMNAITPVIVVIGSGAKALLSGTPTFDSLNESTGYECRLQLLPSTAVGATQEATSVAMFGKHLAPALRQPLGRIIANAETIGGELQGPIRENYAVYARDIANAARHLSALVDDLGDLEAVERADFATAPDRIELGDIARRVAGLLALKAADHSIRIIYPDEGVRIYATAEFRRVLQIMLNLVTNAIRYSPDGTQVSIGISNADDVATINVTDEGAGIPEGDREKIFEKFERLGRSGDGGSGLGLYISRKLARIMGGDLLVTDAEGSGAKFTLSLPSSD